MGHPLSSGHTPLAAATRLTPRSPSLHVPTVVWPISLRSSPRCQVVPISGPTHPLRPRLEAHSPGGLPRAVSSCHSGLSFMSSGKSSLTPVWSSPGAPDRTPLTSSLCAGHEPCLLPNAQTPLLQAPYLAFEPVPGLKSHDALQCGPCLSPRNTLIIIKNYLF